ncbi:MAG: hypothetical protein IKN73_01490 [Alphaproteobacteria bacterium]|nr:hypothetical protein [Alphaproteobacteria bacterium]
MKKIIFAFCGILLTVNAWATMRYEIQVAHNDEFFIINDEKFSAKTFCYSWDGFDQGDYVVFLDGSPLGVCATAVIANPSTGKTCELWCE